MKTLIGVNTGEETAAPETNAVENPPPGRLARASGPMRARRVKSRRTSLPETRQGRPTWQAALLVFLVLAPPVWLLLTLAEWLFR